MPELLEDAIDLSRVRMLERRLLVQRALRPEKTAGGIVLPETTRGLSQAGKVLKVGPDVRDVKEGDVIVFSTYAAAPWIASDDEGILVLREQDVLALCVMG